jgi:hypothetical protein
MQRVVATGTTGAELICAVECAKSFTWVRNFMNELRKGASTPTIMYQDNKPVVDLANNPVYHFRTRHFRISQHYLRDLQESKQIDVIHERSIHMKADFLNKPQPPHRHCESKSWENNVSVFVCRRHTVNIPCRRNKRKLERADLFSRKTVNVGNWTKSQIEGLVDYNECGESYPMFFPCGPRIPSRKFSFVRYFPSQAILSLDLFIMGRVMEGPDPNCWGFADEIEGPDSNCLVVEEKSSSTICEGKKTRKFVDLIPKKRRKTVSFNLTSTDSECVDVIDSDPYQGVIGASSSSKEEIDTDKGVVYAPIMDIDVNGMDIFFNSLSEDNGVIDYTLLDRCIFLEDNSADRKRAEVLELAADKRRALRKRNIDDDIKFAAHLKIVDKNAGGVNEFMESLIMG